ncbi:hypothetical protein T03_9473 [Trichinella britovi]|uniref:Uncharacterized protein n=1 Tax=Trichinella britovi TaxID=45882 RepID=A0A0V0Z027_TRIBR|nr:hypothetical protein T03_9473 [Trichinella britovi]
MYHQQFQMSNNCTNNCKCGFCSVGCPYHTRISNSKNTIHMAGSRGC